MTEIQKLILQAIADAIVETGGPPSVREIAQSCGIPRSTAHDHLNALEEAGYIQREAGRHRRIQLLSPDKCPARILDKLGTRALE